MSKSLTSKHGRYSRTLAKGLHRLVARTGKIKLNWWFGSVAAEETVTTLEPSDARH
jgi:hypothetical protein